MSDCFGISETVRVLQPLHGCATSIWSRASKLASSEQPHLLQRRSLTRPNTAGCSRLVQVRSRPSVASCTQHCAQALASHSLPCVTFVTQTWCSARRQGTWTVGACHGLVWPSCVLLCLRPCLSRFASPSSCGPTETVRRQALSWGPYSFALDDASSMSHQRSAPRVLLWPHEGLLCSCFPSVAHSVTSPLDLASDFAVVRVNHSRRFQLTCDCGTPAIRRRRQVCLEEIPPSLSSLCVPSPLCCAVTTGARACARARLSFLLRVSRFCCAIELWPSCGYAVAGEPEVDW